MLGTRLFVGIPGTSRGGYISSIRPPMRRDSTPTAGSQRRHSWAFHGGPLRANVGRRGTGASSHACSPTNSATSSSPGAPVVPQQEAGHAPSRLARQRGPWRTRPDSRAASTERIECVEGRAEPRAVRTQSAERSIRAHHCRYCSTTCAQLRGLFPSLVNVVRWPRIGSASTSDRRPAPGDRVCGRAVLLGRTAHPRTVAETSAGPRRTHSGCQAACWVR